MSSVLLSLLSLLSFPLTGPDASPIHGVVRNAAGATVPNAKIEVTCGKTVRRVTATGAGLFSVSGLPAEACTLTARASGFAKAETPIVVGEEMTPFVVITLTLSLVREDVLVSATRGMDESAFWVPEATSVTTREEMTTRTGPLMPQALREEPGVVVQQTTTGQASPTIRGFTGQSNAYLIDGVRLNVSTWRSGPSQYMAWIDGAAVDRLDVVRGPGSVQSGSDALGGTINIRTMTPSLVTGPLQVHGGFDASTATADRSAGGSAHLTVQGARAAIRVGMNRRTVGDLRTGGGIDSHAAVTRFLGLPNTTYGPRLRDTGFKSGGYFGAGTLRLDLRSSLSAMYLHNDQTGASRYDRIFGGDGVFKSGFTPQTLDFGYLRYQVSGLGVFDTLQATVSINQQKDGRFEQTRPASTLDRQNATARTWGYAVEGTRSVARHHVISAGGEYYDEGITAARSIDNVITGVSAPNRPDVPTGTTYRTLGGFVQDVTELIPNRLSLRGGVRFARYEFTSTADAAFFVPAEQVVSTAFTYNAGLVYGLTRHVNLTLTTSRGFRAPNSADLGSIGLSGGGGFSITPSRAAALGGKMGTTAGTDAVSSGLDIPAVRPEVLYAYEGGVKVSFAHVGGAVSVYDLEYEDSIVARAIAFPAGLVGQTIAGFPVTKQDASGIAYIAQDARPINTRVNVDHSRIRGVDVEAHAQAGHVTASGYYSRATGTILATGEAMRRFPPGMGGARLRYAPASTLWIEGTMAFAREQTRMNAGDLTDARIGGNRTRTQIQSFFNGSAVDLGLVSGGILLSTGETFTQVQTRLLGTATGAPLFSTAKGWAIYGVRGAWTVSKTLTVTAIGENLGDRNYRIHGSGADAAGRNVQLVLGVKF